MFHSQILEKRKRILLVGDSIRVGYGKYVQEQIPEYCVDQLNTSERTQHLNFFRLLQIVLEQYSYGLIHINNGIHIHGITAKEYEHNLRAIFQWIHMISPLTRIVFAATTPVSKKKMTTDKYQSPSFQLGDRSPFEEGEQTEYKYSPEDSAFYAELNGIATELCKECGIRFNDLFSFCNLEKLPKTDPVHFKEIGYRRLAELVSEVVTDGIAERRKNETKCDYYYG